MGGRPGREKGPRPPGAGGRSLLQPKQEVTHCSPMCPGHWDIKTVAEITNSTAQPRKAAWAIQLFPVPTIHERNINRHTSKTQVLSQISWDNFSFMEPSDLDAHFSMEHLPRLSHRHIPNGCPHQPYPCSPLMSVSCHTKRSHCSLRLPGQKPRGLYFPPLHILSPRSYGFRCKTPFECICSSTVPLL